MSDTEYTTRRNPEMEKYVKIQPVITEDGEQFAIYLQVANQQMRVGQYPEETLNGAEWMRDMLCIALARIVADHRSYNEDDPCHGPQDTTCASCGLGRI